MIYNGCVLKLVPDDYLILNIHNQMCKIYLITIGFKEFSVKGASGLRIKLASDLGDRQCATDITRTHILYVVDDDNHSYSTCNSYG